jgi:hypothetical protein
MSRIRRLLVTDRIFFANVNVRRVHKSFTDSEYPLILEVLKDSRRRLRFLLCGYVLDARSLARLDLADLSAVDF